MSHPLVNLALGAIERYLATGEIISPPATPLPGTCGRAGVSVSLKKQGALRGCIGTFEPACASISEETIRNAVSAAVSDPRFPPLEPQELPEIKCSVDVLSSPEPVSSPSELDPEKYGVIVESGLRRGLLLPKLEGVRTTHEQIAIAKQKAGIEQHEPCKMFRFTVERYY